MTFTVAVERRSPDEQFKAEGIKLFHQECGGGEITRRDEGPAGEPDHWSLQCRRCHVIVNARVSKNGTALLMKTAIDGESREIEKYYDLEDDIYAIPRT
jgi:hypothetical protein